MRAWILILVAVVACKNGGGDSRRGEPSSTADVDALWKLAPAGTMVGVVASPRALQMFEHAVLDIRTFITKAPDLASVAAEIEKELSKLPTGQDLRYAAMGLSTEKGAAVFIGKSGEVVILPVVDRDKFLAFMHGTRGDKEDLIPDGGMCTQIHGVYACGSREMLDKIGSGDIVNGLALAHARGDIEVVVRDVPNGPPGLAVAGVIQLERGGFTIRGAVDGVPKQITRMLQGGAKPRTQDGHATGFAVANVKAWLANVGLPPKPVIPGVTLADLAGAVDDPITLTTYRGGFDTRIPLSDVKPFRSVLDQCATLLAGVGAKPIEGGCRFPIPNTGVEADAWIDGQELRLGHKGSKAPATGEMTPLGKELADSSWQFALWGHGTIYDAGNALAAQAAQLQLSELASTAVRVMTMMNEVGLGVRSDGDTVRFVVGVRTLWSNSDDIVAKVIAIDPADVLAGKATAAARKIADAAKSSPFANDLDSGYSGMMIPTTAVGVLAAVAIPAVLDYMKKSKKSEASVHLNRIGMGLKRYYARNASFPKGDAGPANAAGCCGGMSVPGVVDNKCRPDPSIKDPIWTALDFALDEPTIYQYRYHSDGQTAKVEAIGDVDCDGTAATWTLEVKTNAGVPVLDMRPPPPGVY